MKKSAVAVAVLVIMGLGCRQPTDIPVYRSAQPHELAVCSFNIQFLGNFKKRANETLAKVVQDYDIVVVQELVAPPLDGTYPDGTHYSADAEAAEFFMAMQNRGFSYVLSEEDTGTGDEIHRATSATEWWVTFFKPDVIGCAEDVPHGFLAEDRSNNPNYERVPYAFAFRTLDNHLDFVLISVHLQPGDSGADQARRSHELASIAQWIDDHDEHEHDFVIMGDMNIKDVEELGSVTPQGFVSLNNKCCPTNTNPNGPKPYDHIMCNPACTPEINVGSFQVIDLIQAVRPFWPSSNGSFCGDPYDHNGFRQYYSDHHPVVFTMSIPAVDDD